MPALSVIAGFNAADRIEREGLSPSLVKIVAGASGSAKWLVLAGLDKYIFGDWLVEHQDPIQLIGSSIGAWRMAAIAQQDAGRAIDIFLEGYLSFHVEKGMTAKDITAESYRALEYYLGPKARDEAVSNPHRQLNVSVVAGKGACGSRNKIKLAAGITKAMVKNRKDRRFVGESFDRVLLRSQAGGIDLCHFKNDGFTTRTARLTSENLHDAVMASGAIPFVTEPVNSIAGLPDGLYMDGGVIDYHFDVDWHLEEGIVLYPHFYNYLIPGWFDKNLDRRASASRMKNVMLLSPSDEFVASLPGGTIPARQNFKEMGNAERIAYWKLCVAESRRLADEFQELVEKPNKLMDRMTRLA